MKPPYQVLLINDNKSYSESIIEKAKINRIVIEYCCSLEEGVEILKSKRSISAVILDDIGMLKKNDTKTDAFASMALKNIQKIRPDILLFCITTEMFPSFNALRGLGVRIFERTEIHINELINYLLNEISKLPITKLKNEFDEIFSIIELVFPDPIHQQKLITILENINVKDKNLILKNLQDIRFLEEVFFFRCEELFYPSIETPDEKKQNVKNIIFRLTDHQLPYPLKKRASELYNFSSNHAIHANLGIDLSSISMYTNKRSIYELLEIIISVSECKDFKKLTHY